MAIPRYANCAMLPDVALNAIIVAMKLTMKEEISILFRSVYCISMNNDHIFEI